MKKLFLTNDSKPQYVLMIWISTLIFLAIFSCNPRLSVKPSHKFRVAHLKEDATNYLPTQINKLNINLASSDELIQLKGIGPVLANRIVKHRESHGKFGSVSSLSEVKGLGSKKISKFADRIEF
jgi:competence ComEA-like helix-hairpin-helix protein